ncbi:cation-transporting ATPase [Allosaccharopolyspora coralli]|uniref:Cation-transporting ATPase n=1 Tax=Allosaccharopolyspora coralli TaxID=2665642 RepID=A0A5Q3Q7T8_9PSEU|nr:heavy-metal-associated domain-containing protein [Allosaccharopolyspora coralli]QGK70552.1 cation-transporting ATPase [Allosaccharopolyspora coralli]
MAESRYTVTGMTCQHCVMSVTEEVSEIDGVTDVQVDLPTGALTVVSSQDVSERAVRSAVDEAGFALADA